MELIEASPFTRLLRDYLDDEQYQALQTALVRNPRAGRVMPGTGGFRKMRWADPSRGKGRRGGVRVIYYYFESDRQIWLMTIYNKDEAADLSEAEKKALRTALEAELEQRAVRRVKRR